MYKILFGIPSDFELLSKGRKVVNESGFIEDHELEDSEDIWCDFSIEYDIKENFYYLQFETMLGFNGKDGARNWIITCYEELTSYMKRHGYNTDKELDMYQVFTEGINVNSRFETIEDAYAFVKFAAFGFHGDGLFYSQENSDGQ